MRQAGKIQVSDLLSKEQIQNDAILGVPRRADEIFIILVEEEIVEIVIQFDPAYWELWPVLWRSLVAIRDLPDFLEIF